MVAGVFNAMFKGYAEDIASKSGTTVDIPADVLETANAEILVSPMRRCLWEQVRSLLGLIFFLLFLLPGAKEALGQRRFGCLGLRKEDQPCVAR